MGLKIIPNVFISIQAVSGYKYCLAALTPVTGENFIVGFDEETNKILYFPREQIIVMEIYSISDVKNEMEENDDAL